MRKLRIAILSPYPLMAQGIERAFADENEISIVGTSQQHADDAIRLVQSTKPDILILDHDIRGCVLSAARLLKVLHASTKLLVFADSENVQHLLAALEAGASAYVLKKVTSEEFVNIIKLVEQGDTYIPPEFAGQLLIPLLDRPLSSRETQILNEVATGKTNREIASTFGLSEKTVKHHMTSVLQKVGARNRIEAMMTMRGSKELGGA